MGKKVEKAIYTIFEISDGHLLIKMMDVNDGT
jgi:hypothetical protein